MHRHCSLTFSLVKVAASAHLVYSGSTCFPFDPAASVRNSVKSKNRTSLASQFPHWLKQLDHAILVKRSW